jgi:hypothetical protein
MRVSLFVLLVGIIASGCSDRATEQPAGELGGACFPNNTCNAGLSCFSGICVQTTDAALTDGATHDGVGPAQDSVGPDLNSSAPFSFFVTSLEAMRKLSGSQDGFGGALGGLTGADTICQQTAATVGGGAKTWRAFLSVTKGSDGKPVNAIDRIGSGPWYDRNGRLMAKDLAGLQQTRPLADAQIANDLPNELGQPQKQFGDNHDVLTGSNKLGQLNSTNPASTCQDWTSAVGPGSEKKVMAGHSWPSSKSPGWIQAHTVPGCAAGVNLIQNGSGQGTIHVGGAGGYGAIYCFALTP